jgi:hypothetical protein
MKWTVKYTSVHKTPGGAWLLDLPQGTLCEPTGQTQTIPYRGLPQTNWTEIIVRFAIREWQGWIYSPCLEEYTEEFPPIVPIAFPTPTPQDAAQYIIWRKNIQFNLCGQFCICYLLGKNIEDLLAFWELKAAPWYKRILKNERSQPTGIPDLDSILSLFGFPVPSVTFNGGLKDPLLGRALITPARMAAKLQTHQAIIGVKINSLTGELRPTGTPHWVVLEKCIPDGINRGMIELYNPFPNRIQRYSWNEFATSAGLLGIWVERKIIESL